MLTSADRPAGTAQTAPGRVADPMRPRLYQVQRAVRELPDTVTLAMTPADAAEPLHFAPGQFNMLYAPGVGEIPISVSGDPGRPELLIHTIRNVGPVSRALCNLGRGAMLGVRGPFGTRWPVDAAIGSDVVVAAGGIGLAPLRPVMYYLLSHREQYGKIVLLYGARTPADLLYPRELERWRGQFDLDVQVTVDRGTDAWRGHVGTVTTLIPRAGFDPQHTVALVCGPEIMMHFTILELQKAGVTNPQIYISMERNMQCGIGLCGHCQLGPLFICKDGPVFRFSDIAPWFRRREV
jgi:NAD(P)H-flavin reductase